VVIEIIWQTLILSGMSTITVSLLAHSGGAHTTWAITWEYLGLQRKDIFHPISQIF
jgi:hypothetical protein